jgi:hypothetical protein
MLHKYSDGYPTKGTGCLFCLSSSRQWSPVRVWGADCRAACRVDVLCEGRRCVGVDLPAASEFCNTDADAATDDATVWCCHCLSMACVTLAQDNTCLRPPPCQSHWNGLAADGRCLKWQHGDGACLSCWCYYTTCAAVCRCCRRPCQLNFNI